jgi:predicted ferric reductase
MWCGKAGGSSPSATTMQKKVIFYAVWVALLSIAVATAFLNTPASSIFMHKAATMNFIQRLLGLTAFTMLFSQIVLGAYMDKFVQKLGGWVFNFHVFQGRLIFLLIVLHPLIYVFYRYFAGMKPDALGTFLDVCVLCKNNVEFYFSFGRIAFWLVNIGVLAAVFRAANPFMRVHWRKFHILNYLAFLFTGIHGYFLGTDFSAMPFFAFGILASLIIVGIIITRLPTLIREFK